jgi:hypothetical protein
MADTVSVLGLLRSTMADRSHLLNVCLPVENMAERFRFLSAYQLTRWRKGSVSCLLTIYQLTRWRKGSVPVCLPVDKMAESSFSCLLTSWQDGGKVPFPVCLPVEKMAERFRFLSVYQLTRWRKGSFSFLLTSWQDGGKVPFPVCLPVDKMAERFLFLSAYQLTRWRKGSFSCLLTSWQDGGLVPFLRGFSAVLRNTRPCQSRPIWNT